MSDETTETPEPVKLFKSKSRKQRMFAYAMQRTPVWTPQGKALLRVLSRVIEEGQPTPQVSTNSGEDDGSVLCTWLVAGRSVDLWVFTEDGKVSFEVEQDNDDADRWHGDDVRPTELTFKTEEELVSWLRETLTGLGEGVKHPLV